MFERMRDDTVDFDLEGVSGGRSGTVHWLARKLASEAPARDDRPEPPWRDRFLPTLKEVYQEKVKDDWLIALARATEGYLLDRSQSERGTGDPEPERYALAWEALIDGSVTIDNPVDANHRLFAFGDDERCAAGAQHGRWHAQPPDTVNSVWFPVSNDYEQKSLVEVRVCPLRPNRLPPAVRSRAVLLAPWSTMAYPGKDVASLNDEIAAASASWPENRCFLVELRRPEGFSWMVDGGSLGLAVLLAAWASCRGQLLRPNLVATGVLKNGRVIEDMKKRTLDSKNSAVRESLAGKKWLYLVPSNSQDVVQPDGAKILKVENFGQLIADHEKELTDGACHYREWLRNLSPISPVGDVPPQPDESEGLAQCDVDELNAVAESVRHSSSSKPVEVHTLPFDSEPLAAVRHACRALVSDACVPLPVPLVASAAWAAARVERGLSVMEVPDRPLDAALAAWLTERVEQGLSEMPTDTLDAERRAHLLAVMGTHLVFVVYAPRSSTFDFGSVGRAYGGVLNYAGKHHEGRRPRILALASDIYHHGQLTELAPDWSPGGPAEK